MELRGYDLRYLITSFILDQGASTTSAIRSRLLALGVDLGPDPRRLLYGAIRSEVRKGRLVRVRPSTYTATALPRSTRDWVRRHARDVEAALAAGEDPPFRHRWAHQTTGASPVRDAARMPGPQPRGPMDHPIRASRTG